MSLWHTGMATAWLGVWYEQDAKFFYDKPRPQKRYEVRRCDRGEWAKFRRYHYLNTDISSACVCYGLFDAGSIVGFCGVLHQPHGKNQKLKRVSRLVILPDYQGIGLGYKFLNCVADHYKKLGFDFTIVTSAKNLIWKLYNSEKWTMHRLGVSVCISNKSAIDYKRASARSNCKTAGFKYEPWKVERVL